MRVLIIEDEQRLAQTIARGLSRYGLAVDLALDDRLAPDADDLAAMDAGRCLARDVDVAPDRLVTLRRDRNVAIRAER